MDDKSNNENYQKEKEREKLIDEQKVIEKEKEKENENNKNKIEDIKEDCESYFQTIANRIEKLERNCEKIKKEHEKIDRNIEEMKRKTKVMERRLGLIVENLGINQNNYTHLLETKIETNKLNDEKKRCIICYEDFKDNDNAIFLPCFHVFHSKCINEWLKNKDNCPLCKIEIKNNLNNNF